ncbi:hypothetical protein Pcinc_021054 [Petrolisthes cinctipes]|uniref:Uncharacterized protein n=1 Tax=Petrolisthes cinctipes TaxID=88211 RepID=A0AAE1FHT1_PETCI|nr:hypothetical protein Pcinc_021054 [Petrolisthes cinctipes]
MDGGEWVHKKTCGRVLVLVMVMAVLADHMLTEAKPRPTGQQEDGVEKCCFGGCGGDGGIGGGLGPKGDGGEGSGGFRGGMYICV